MLKVKQEMREGQDVTNVQVNGEPKVLELELTALIVSLKYNGLDDGEIMEAVLKGLALKDYVESKGESMDDIIVDRK